MNEPRATVSANGRQRSLSQYDDEPARASARIGTVRLVWDRASTVGTIWVANAADLHFSVPLDSPSPDVGQIVEISAQLDLRRFEGFASVESLTEVYGSFKLILCRMRSNEEVTLPTMQRRGNTRFTFSPLYPLFCFARNPLDGRVTPLRATDASNGGISLVGAPSEKIPLIGLEIPCQFDAPAIGAFSANVVFRHIDRPSDGASLRVSAEFLGLSEHARDIIGSCITRPMSSNPIRELKRERLLPRFWPDLVDFSLVPTDDNSKCEHSDLNLVGRLADEVVCNYAVNRRNRSECVVSCGPEVSELDALELRAAALKAVILQSKSIGTNNVSLREAKPSQVSSIASSSQNILGPTAYRRSTNAAARIVMGRSRDEAGRKHGRKYGGTSMPKPTT